MSCSGEGCTSTYIQNKKYNLCGECMFKKTHEGKSKAEVYTERALEKARTRTDLSPPGKTASSYKKSNIPTIDIDEESAKNIRNQDLAEQQEKDDLMKAMNLGIFESGDKNFIPTHIQTFSAPNGKILVHEYDIQKKTSTTTPLFGDPKPEKKEKKKKKQIKQKSAKQSQIDRLYILTCADMDHITEPVCTGCLRYQGGEIRLSHSHIISRDDCHDIGRDDLISDRENLTYHCMDFGGHKGCHLKWENRTQRHTLLDYEKNLAYIKTISSEMFERYKVNAEP